MKPLIALLAVAAMFTLSACQSSKCCKSSGTSHCEKSGK